MNERRNVAATMLRKRPRPQLTAAQLAHFATPKTWRQILQLEPRMTTSQWRTAIVDADEHGSGLLTWLREPAPIGASRDPNERARRRGAWVLTDKGRALVARESEAAA